MQRDSCLMSKCSSEQLVRRSNSNGRRQKSDVYHLLRIFKIGTTEENWSQQLRTESYLVIHMESAINLACLADNTSHFAGQKCARVGRSDTHSKSVTCILQPADVCPVATPTPRWRPQALRLVSGPTCCRCCPLVWRFSTPLQHGCCWRSSMSAPGPQKRKVCY